MCKDGKPAGSDFDYAGPLAEFVLFGNVALRAGRKKIEYDRDDMEVMNEREANQFIHTYYSEGWVL